jgi:hypothetical protein
MELFDSVRAFHMGAGIVGYINECLTCHNFSEDKRFSLELSSCDMAPYPHVKLQLTGPIGDNPKVVYPNSVMMRMDDEFVKAMPDFLAPDKNTVSFAPLEEAGKLYHATWDYFRNQAGQCIMEYLLEGTKA